MASTHAKAVRRASVLQRLSARLGVEQADLHAQAKGDPEMALIMTLERVADAVEAGVPAPQAADLKSVEQELEAETGHDVVKTADEPPAFVETDKPAPKSSKAKK